MEADHDDPAYNGKLYDATPFLPSNALWAALKRHFEARLISADKPTPHISLVKVKECEYRAYNAYNSGPRNGNQVYRTAACKRGIRDASWLIVRTDIPASYTFCSVRFHLFCYDDALASTTSRKMATRIYPLRQPTISGGAVHNHGVRSSCFCSVDGRIKRRSWR